MNYFKDSFEEIRKVTWPTRNHAMKVTIISIIFIFISTIIVTSVDIGFRKGYDKLIEISPKLQKERAAKADAQTTPPINVDGIKVLDDAGNPIGTATKNPTTK